MGDDSLGAWIVKLGADLTQLKAGLLDGKREFALFQKTILEGVENVKGLLKFAGLGFGFYELISQAKQFGQSILEEGGKVEVLKGAATSLAAYYGMSAASLDLYTEKLKEKNITEGSALKAESGFLKAGVSVDQLPQLADAAKVLGASMGMPMQEAFDALVQGIVKGTPKQMAEMVPGIREIMAGLSQETKSMLDSTLISGAEKSQILLNAALEAAARMKGASGELEASYYAQLNAYKAKVAEVKEGLFELLKPIGMAITQQEIKSWDDFYIAIGKNKQALKDIGETVAVYVGKLASGIRTITGFAAQHKDLLLALLDIKGALTMIKWTGISAGAEAISGVLVKLGLLRTALAGPWALTIVVALVGADYAYKKMVELGNKVKEQGTDQSMLERWGIKRPDWLKTDSESHPTQATARQVGQMIGAVDKANPDYNADLAGQINANAQAKAESDAAAKKRKDQANSQLPPAKGTTGKSEAEKEYDAQVREYLKMVETIRQADLKSAESGIEILKAEHAAKKSELEEQLSEGLISGQTYYQRLKEMEDGETKASLALIDKKKVAQQQAFQDALKGVALEDVSPEVKAYKSYDLEMKNRAELAKLDADAVKIRFEGEIQVTNELKRQVELKKQYREKTEDLNLETDQLLGAVSSQEATLQKLYLDWQRAKQEAIKAGADPAYLAALDRNLAAKKSDALYGGYSGSITQGLSTMIDNLFSSSSTPLMQQMQQGFNNMFKSLFNEALKPSLDQLKSLLTSGFQDLFGGAGSAISSAVMGAIGLIGMLLTSSSKSSWNASSIQSSITSSQALRGIIAGPSTVPIADISVELQDALVPTNGILTDIYNAILNGGGGTAGRGAGGTVLLVNALTPQTLKAFLDQYFATLLMKGAPA